VRAASNDRLADYIARCGIDILVDLNGYSQPSRLDLFMRRPAPVIVGWFNMFATTGIDGFDYIVGDDAVIPPDEERFYSERVLRVPGSYLAFNVLYPVPEVTPPPMLATGSLTFGCFCSQYKITDETIAAFAAILQGAPKARLLLKSRPARDESNRRRCGRASHATGSRRIAFSWTVPPSTSRSSPPTSAWTSRSTPFPTAAARRRWRRSGRACLS